MSIPKDKIKVHNVASAIHNVDSRITEPVRARDEWKLLWSWMAVRLHYIQFIPN